MFGTTENTESTDGRGRVSHSAGSESVLSVFSVVPFSKNVSAFGF
jgi:hypothetical protein